MSVSFFWRRTSADVIASSSPQELLDMTLNWREEDPDLCAAGQIAYAESHSGLMDRVLRECCPEQPAAALPVYGGEARTDAGTNPDGEVEGYVAVVVLAPDAVAAAAEVMAHAEYAAWIAAHPQRMTEIVRDLRHSTPWSDAWAKHLVEDLEDLEDFYAAAAAAGDAVVKHQSC